LGKYQKTLAPGIKCCLCPIAFLNQKLSRYWNLSLNLVWLLTDVSVNVSGSMYWKLPTSKKARYSINDIDKSLIGSLTAQIQTQVGVYELDNVIGSQIHIKYEEV
jgi:hypothetical protein